MYSAATQQDQRHSSTKDEPGSCIPGPSQLLYRFIPKSNFVTPSLTHFPKRQWSLIPNFTIFNFNLFLHESWTSKYEIISCIRYLSFIRKSSQSLLTQEIRKDLGTKLTTPELWTKWSARGHGILEGLGSSPTRHYKLTIFNHSWVALDHLHAMVKTT